MNYFYDVMASFLILLVFGLIFLGLALAALAKDIKKNWPKYKCNPMIMPVAGAFGKDPGKNFVECIGTIQAGFMGYFLGPIRYIMGFLGNIGGDIMNSMNFLRKLLRSISGALMGILESVFGVFFNVIIRFQLIMIALKDLMMKILGIFLLMGYFFDGSRRTLQSAANGPIGLMIDAFGCFPVDTPIQLINGDYKKISELNLGDILINRSEIRAILKVKGDKRNPYYKIWSKKLNKFIFVTGDHLIKHPINGEFIMVKDYENAQNTMSWDKEMTNLVTSNNNIPIGEFTFWDWED